MSYERGMSRENYSRAGHKVKFFAANLKPRYGGCRRMLRQTQAQMSVLFAGSSCLDIRTQRRENSLVSKASVMHSRTPSPGNLRPCKQFLRSVKCQPWSYQSLV